ncbi:MAG: hypothetical protein IJQ82_13475, partial [Selenomonadaceae bacterium]|nr:hypothetical protein [Selenomonadaceae bacterium]
RILYRVFTALITAFHNTATRSISDRKVRTCFGRSVLVRENSFQAIPNVTGLSVEVVRSLPAVIFTITLLGLLIPLFIAKKFGKLPVLKYFCP